MSVAGRVQRLVGGVALIVPAMLGFGAPWTWIGIVPLTAGIVGWCPFTVLRAQLARKGDVGAK
ncbi:MAG: DUF2892 domain-containing protein [Bradyrhizobium sp.]|nr:DUF2892 domain-containing protein [Bradyrhizobium sp.]